MLSDNIKRFRKNKGYSQEKLAEEAGVSLRTVQRLENGETDPTGDTLTRIAKALEITPDDLLEWEQIEDTTYLLLLNISALSFLLFPLLNVLLPLLLWVTKKKTVKMVDQMGKQILNFQITWLVILFLGVILGVLNIMDGFSLAEQEGDVSSSIISENISGALLPMAVFVLVMYGYNALLTIYNAILAGKGKEVWYYPRINFMR